MPVRHGFDGNVERFMARLMLYAALSMLLVNAGGVVLGLHAHVVHHRSSIFSCSVQRDLGKQRLNWYCNASPTSCESAEHASTSASPPPNKQWESKNQHTIELRETKTITRAAQLPGLKTCQSIPEFHPTTAAPIAIKLLLRIRTTSVRITTTQSSGSTPKPAATCHLWVNRGGRPLTSEQTTCAFIGTDTTRTTDW